MTTPAKRQRPRHLVLLCLLLLLFIVAPIIAPLRYGVLILNLMGAAILLSGTHVVRDRRKLHVVTIAIAVAAVIINFFISIYKSEQLILLSQVFLLVLLALFSGSILAEVLRAGRITADKIYGAICFYLLIGFAWAFVYAILEQIDPGSFSMPQETGGVAEHVARIMRLRYFSFVTLTTLGFGDITPRSAEARNLVVLEAIMGQLYLAILVARLVGLHIAHGKESEDEDDSRS
jgi:voltage-gated potassium channel